MRKAVVLFGTVVFIAVLGVTGCSQPVSAPESGVGYVSLSIPGVASQQNARTALPSGFTFTSYKLVFTKDGGGGEPVVLSYTTLPAAIPLAPGTWELDLTAYIGEAIEGNIAATGTTTGITVTDGAVTPVAVAITFSPPAGGDMGTLSYNITNSTGIVPAEAKIVLTKLGISADDIEIDLFLSNVYTGTGTKTDIPAGYYRAVVTLETEINGNADKKAVWGDVVHIYKNQSTSFVHTFVTEDLNRTIENVWLVGSMNSGGWNLDTPPFGEVMNKQTDGTFAWAGDVGADATFRFSLTDTSGWGEIRKGDWLAPETDNTSVENSTYPMEFITNYAGTNNAWKFNSDGYYIITVNPGTLQMTVAKPDIVETVTINEGNAVLKTGDEKTFTVTVAGKNNFADTVTWSVTGNTGEGTTIAPDGKLTIAADEAATNLTVTATSTADAGKSDSITVTISTKTQLTRVTTLALSGQGAATWNGESDDIHVEKYTVALYKAGESGEQAAPITTAEVNQGGTYSKDFFSDINTSGPGSYYITVTAQADPDGEYADANESAPSTSQTFGRRAGVQFVWWSGTEAEWVDPDASGDYEVQLYKLVSGNLTKDGGAISVTREGTFHQTTAQGTETKTNHDFGATLNNGEVYAFTVTTKGTRPVLDGEPSALPVKDTNGVPIVYSSSAYNKAVYQWEESNLSYFEMDETVTTDWVIPSGKTLVIKAGKTLTLTGATLTAGNIKLGPGVWKATEADVSITANTVTLGSHATAGFGNGTGLDSAVLTGQLGAANTFTASGGVITLGQSGHDLGVTGDPASAKLVMGATARLYAKLGNITLATAVLELAAGASIHIEGNGKFIAGEYLDLGKGMWKAGGSSVTITHNTITPSDGARFNQTGEWDKTLLQGGPGDSSFTASGAKITLKQDEFDGRQGVLWIIADPSSPATLSVGATAILNVKYDLTVEKVTIDLSAGGSIVIPSDSTNDSNRRRIVLNSTASVIKLNNEEITSSDNGKWNSTGGNLNVGSNVQIKKASDGKVVSFIGAGYQESNDHYAIREWYSEHLDSKEVKIQDGWRGNW